MINPESINTKTTTTNNDGHLGCDWDYLQECDGVIPTNWITTTSKINMDCMIARSVNF